MWGRAACWKSRLSPDSHAVLLPPLLLVLVLLGQVRLGGAADQTQRRGQHGQSCRCVLHCSWPGPLPSALLRGTSLPSLLVLLLLHHDCSLLRQHVQTAAAPALWPPAPLLSCLGLRGATAKKTQAHAPPLLTSAQPLAERLTVWPAACARAARLNLPKKPKTQRLQHNRQQPAQLTCGMLLVPAAVSVGADRPSKLLT